MKAKRESTLFSSFRKFHLRNYTTDLTKVEFHIPSGIYVFCFLGRSIIFITHPPLQQETKLHNGSKRIVPSDILGVPEDIFNPERERDRVRA
jgi:hypothetical protein